MSMLYFLLAYGAFICPLCDSGLHAVDSIKSSGKAVEKESSLCLYHPIHWNVLKMNWVVSESLRMGLNNKDLFS